jgi:hypothetical protein
MPQEVKLFHGTSWSRALQIERSGFQLSEDGYLGPGVYCADEKKAAGYAKFRAAKDGETGPTKWGALLELMVKVRNVKYTTAEDREWQSQGYDACRADRTTLSPKMEWCIASRDQITVLCVHKLTTRHS